MSYVLVCKSDSEEVVIETDACRGLVAEPANRSRAGYCRGGCHRRTWPPPGGTFFSSLVRNVWLGRRNKPPAWVRAAAEHHGHLGVAPSSFVIIISLTMFRTGLRATARITPAVRPAAARAPIAAVPRFSRGYAQNESSEASSQAKDRAAVGVSLQLEQRRR